MRRSARQSRAADFGEEMKKLKSKKKQIAYGCRLSGETAAYAAMQVYGKYGKLHRTIIGAKKEAIECENKFNYKIFKVTFQDVE